jgi:hypothetical protein
MAKYIGKPVEVQAFEIQVVGEPDADGNRLATCSEDRTFTITPEMTSRITLEPGLFVVIQADGYMYLNPPDVFYRKYRPADLAVHGDAPHDRPHVPRTRTAND